MRNSTVTQTMVATPSSNRRQSARQARTSSSRPNYYARPFAGRGSALGVVDNGPSNNSAPGFFPAITHFTDSVAALPKEVMRQFSMLKEVEAKIHGPDEEIRNLADAISKLPTPPRRHSYSLPEISPGMTANTSANASVSGSVHNGATPMYHQQSGGFDQQDNQAQSSDEQAALQRAQLFYRLSWVIHHMNPILDEKIAVLSNANRILATQLDRMESSYPYIEDEISEEARLGSLAHWAYADKEAKKTAVNERTRRDVVAANSLAAAAAAMHEGDIAAASRSEARREAMLANKRNRNQHIDSDFDDRPAKRPPANRTRKPVEPGMAADLKAVGLGITNGAAQPNKRRKTEKNGAVVPTMERSISGVLGNGSRTGGASPRETPAAENGRKRVKAAHVPAPVRKRQMTSAQSPPLASSPLIGTFTTARDSIARPHNSRVRQNSVTSSVNPIAHNNTQNRPTSATSTRPMSGILPGTIDIHPLAASSALITVPDNTAPLAADTTELPPTDPSNLKREDPELQGNPMPDVDAPTATTVITRASRASKTATPMTSSFPTDIPMVRSRSTRNNGGGGGSHRHSHASSEPAVPAAAVTATTIATTTQKRSHKKGAGLAAQAAALAARSRRGVDAGEESDAAPTVGGEEGSNPGLSEDEGAEPETEEEELAGGEGDADAEGEDRYCYCNQVSYGEMVGCDNDDCPIGWFHLECVGLKSAPKSAQWFCNECREGMGGRKSRPVSRQ